MSGLGVLLGLSLTGGALTLLARLLRPLTRRWLSPRWHRAMLCVVLAFYLLPVGPVALLVRRLLPAVSLEAMALPELEFPLPLQWEGFQGAAASQPLWTSVLAAVLPLLPVLWIGVTIALLVHRMITGREFRKLMEETSQPISQGILPQILQEERERLGISRELRLLTNPVLDSPMLTMLSGPALILPPMEWEPEQWRMVLRHELIHFRHRDLPLKRLCLVMCTLHWFNPCMYLLSRQLDGWMELACDAAAMEGMDNRQRRIYGRAILDALRAAGEPSPGVNAALCEQDKNIKERINMLLFGKTQKKSLRPVSVLVMALICSAGMLMGVAGAPVAELDLGGGSPQEDGGTGEVPPSFLKTGEEEEPEESVAPESSQSTMEFLLPIPEGVAGTTYKGHSGNGVDFPRKSGTDVYATAAGVVVETHEGLTGYGHYLIIDHGNGYQSLYAQCESLLVEEGQTVEAGEVIAKVGRSGWATGPHLHFEIRYNGTYMYPLDYLPTAD